MVHLQPQSLLRRGEILLGFDVINNWDAELKEINKDKVGEPFHYPNKTEKYDTRNDVESIFV